MQDQAQADLFEVERVLPPGLVYETDFLSRPEEADLIRAIARLPLEQARYKEYVARRRTANFGSQYDFDRNRLGTAPPIPDFLLPLRNRVAQKAGEQSTRFADALVAEYSPGAPLGWHRDVPEFEAIAGVSLGSACRMRFRRYPHSAHVKEKPLDLVLRPRSIYLITGEARSGWQHSVAPASALRYSITFRTRRRA